MSYPMTQLGGHAFNHSPNRDAEAEYDRLRSLARQEHDKKSSLSANSRQAYDRGDGAAAHELSEEGKRHGARMEQYNKQASDFIFKENNAIERIAGDTIDLHGQFVEEAENILQQRIRFAQQQGQTHLHVIVGKGNHSVNHIQKIKPAVEKLCREMGLQFHVEPNAGRMYINLAGGPAIMPAPHGNAGYQQPHGQQHGGQHHGGQYQGDPQGGYHGQQHHNQAHGQQNDQAAQIEHAVEKYLPKLLRKLGCCVVM